MSQTPDISSEKTLFDVLRDVWRAKVYMAVCAVFSMILAFVFINTANPFYRAEMILAPAIPMGQGLHMSSSISEGSGQVQPNDLQNSAAFLRFEHIYDGASVASILMNDDKVLESLAFDRPFTLSSVEKQWNAQSLSEYLQKRVRLEPVSGSPLRKLTYYHPNKDFSITMITRIHRIADEIIRARILREVSERIIYLNNALSTVSNPDHRRNLAELLMEQERLKMMVSLDQPFAASIVEPASVSAHPKWPDSYLIYPIFLCVGLLLGFIIHGMRRHG